jgi:hypothetical protein
MLTCNLSKLMEIIMDFNNVSIAEKVRCAAHYISAAKDLKDWLSFKFDIKDAEQATQSQLLKVFNTLEWLENWHEDGDYDYYFEIGSVDSKSGNPVIVGVDKG